MLVQKRTPDSDPPPGGAPVPTIRVKVKFAGVTHEVYVNSQASFGELKNLMFEKTGLDPEDQKVLYKDRERDSKEFLDMVGVRDRSKMTMAEDPEAQARRLIEERRNAKAQKAAKAVSRIILNIDKLASKVYVVASSSSLPSIYGILHGGWVVELTWCAFQVSALETIINKGRRMVEADVVALTETLMNELVRLDADADIKV
jgi:hypothetical protein